MGMNPLAIFVLMIFLEILLLDTIRWKGDNLWFVGALHQEHCVVLVFTLLVSLLRNRIYWDVFQVWIVQKELASLAVSFVHVCVWVLFAWGMHRKKWYIKA
jgi:hypothetical protein